jgi:hypothetical protein
MNACFNPVREGEPILSKDITENSDSLRCSSVIFLDMDGVLNDHTPMDNRYCGVKKECVANFNQILDAVPDAKIVISSAWRYMILRGDVTVKGFEMLLLTHGVKCFQRVIGHTIADGPIEDEPHHHDEPAKWRENTMRERGHQIMSWAIEHGVQKFVALDDLHIGIPNHYWVDSESGLTQSDVNAVVALIR